MAGIALILDVLCLSSGGFLALIKHSYRKAFRSVTVAVWRNWRGNFSSI